jgi:hypothetical protein
VRSLLDLGATRGIQPFTIGSVSTLSTSVTKAGTFAGTTTLTYRCQDNTANGCDSITVSKVHLIATNVGALHAM